MHREDHCLACSHKINKRNKHIELTRHFLIYRIKAQPTYSWNSVKQQGNPKISDRKLQLSRKIYITLKLFEVETSFMVGTVIADTVISLPFNKKKRAELKKKSKVNTRKKIESQPTKKKTNLSVNKVSRRIKQTNKQIESSTPI